MKYFKSMMEEIIAESVKIQLDKYTVKREIKIFRFFLNLFEKYMNSTEKKIAKNFLIEIKRNFASINFSNNLTQKFIKKIENELYDLVELSDALEMISLMKQKDLNLEKISKLINAELSMQ